MKFVEKLIKNIKKEENGVPATPVKSADIEKIFENCADFTIRDLNLGLLGAVSAKICFFDGLISGDATGEQVIRPLTDPIRFIGIKNEREAVESILTGSAYGCTAKRRKRTDEVVADLLYGWCAVIFDGVREAVCFELKSSEKRSIDQPKEEKVVKGAKDAFIEIIRSNTALVRKKLKYPRR